MKPKNIINPQRKCSFCERQETEVKKMIAGTDAYICNECVKYCSDILHEKKQNKDFALLKPKEIYQKLNDYVIGQKEYSKYLLKRRVLPLPVGPIKSTLDFCTSTSIF